MGAGGEVSVVEVGPRDGFQAIGPIIPQLTKIDLVRRLHSVGVRRIEVTAFVNPRAVPQMADCAGVLAAAKALSGLDAQVLVPNQSYAEAAVEAGADHLVFVLSVSEKHNLSNVRRKPDESAEEYARLVRSLPTSLKIRLNIATAFDCPFDGPVRPSAVMALLDKLIAVKSDVEIAFCDTTGRVTPDRVRELFDDAMRSYPGVSQWAFHGHDTYGLGIANILSAYASGVRVFDAAFGGLGGCPFAPGATGNVATEDVVWLLEKMGIATKIDLEGLLAVAQEAVLLPGASPGGRVRTAIRAGRKSGA